MTKKIEFFFESTDVEEMINDIHARNDYNGFSAEDVQEIRDKFEKIVEEGRLEYQEYFEINKEKMK